MRPLIFSVAILFVLCVVGCGDNSSTSPSQSASVKPIGNNRSEAIPPAKKLTLLDDFNAINLNDTKSHVLHLMRKNPNHVMNEPAINVAVLEYVDASHDKLEIGIEGKAVYMMGYIPKTGPDLAKPSLPNPAQQTTAEPDSSASSSNAPSFKSDYDAINIGDSRSSVLQTMGREPDWSYPSTDGTKGMVLCYKDSSTGVFNELRIAVRNDAVYRASYFPKSDPVGSVQTKGDEAP